MLKIWDWLLVLGLQGTQQHILSLLNKPNFSNEKFKMSKKTG